MGNLFRAAVGSAALVASAFPPAGAPSPRPPSDSDPGARGWLSGDTMTALGRLGAPGGDRERELNRAVVLIYAGRHEEAEATLSGLRARFPGWVPALRWQARERTEAGHPAAEQTAAALLSAPGADGRDFFWAAGAYRARGDAARARDAFARAVEAEDDLYLGWLGLGDSEAALGHAVDARRAWTRARALHEGGDVLVRLGRSLLEAGDGAAATPLLERALRTPEGAVRREEIERLLPVAPGMSMPGSPPRPSWIAPVLRPGERLRYRAKYLFFRIATLEIQNKGRVLRDGRWAHRIALAIKSNTFLLHIDSHFESLVDEDGTVIGHTNVTEDSTCPRYAATWEMDPPRKTCVVRYVNNGIYGFDRLPLPPLAQDGVSLILLARGVAQARETLSALTAVDGTWKGTQIRVQGMERIEWRDRIMDAVRVESVSSCQGPGGLSGAVTLWVSADGQAVPYRSKMRIALGSVGLELLPDSDVDPAATVP